MIVTVTLNAAIDRTLARTQLPARPAPPGSAALTSAGGKGINVARALKRLGDPGRLRGPRGRAHRRADRRATDERGPPQRLRPDPRGVSHLHRRRRPNVERLHRDQRVGARGRGARARDPAREARLPLPRRGVHGLLAGRSRAASTTTSTSSRSARRTAAACRPCSTPRASPSGVASTQSRGSSPRTCARQSSSSGTSSPGTRISSPRSTRSPSSAPETSWSPPRVGCYALFREDRAEVRLQASAPHLEPISQVGSGDALIAGLIAARVSGKPYEEAVRSGVATGAASVLEAGAGRFDVREVGRLASLVAVRPSRLSRATCRILRKLSVELRPEDVERLLALERKFAKEGLTFDDVLLVPAESAVLPDEVSTAHAVHARRSSSRSRSPRRRWTRSPRRAWRSRSRARAASASIHRNLSDRGAGGARSTRSSARSRG